MSAPGRHESLAELLGGRRSAIEASLPPLAFVAAWQLAGRSVAVGVVVAVVVAAVLALLALRRGSRPRGVLLSLFAVSVAALVALRTGRAEDFFLVQIAANVASGLAWVGSIVVRWPLLGVVVGAVLGQRARWRRDPDLLRAYGRASWVWAASFALRVSVFLPLWAAGEVVALGVARAALSWPLVAAVLAVSWWVLRRTLPAGHPGLRHPRVA